MQLKLLWHVPQKFLAFLHPESTFCILNSVVYHRRKAKVQQKLKDMPSNALQAYAQHLKSSFSLTEDFTSEKKNEML